jgi:hypothetical protein
VDFASVVRTPSASGLAPFLAQHHVGQVIHVYIDESGSFVPEGPAPRVSGVVALFCSGSALDDLLAEFAQLAKTFPSVKGEVKGSKLDEAQVAAVISLLKRYDVLVQAHLIDAASHQHNDLRIFRAGQADTLDKYARTHRDPEVRKQAAQLRDRVESMSNQLFIQAWLTMVVVVDVVRTACLYYGLYNPRALSGFRWTVDAKEASQLTVSEEFWRQFVIPFSKSRSKTDPFLILEDGDYSALSRFMVPGAVPGRGTLNFHELLIEQLQFKDSSAEPGLQLVDVVASAITRAFNKTLKEEGWKELPDLLAGTQPQVIRLGQMNKNRPWPAVNKALLPEHEEVMRKLMASRVLHHRSGSLIRDFR